MKAKKLTGTLTVEIITDGNQSVTRFKEDGNGGCKYMAAIMFLRNFNQGMPKEMLPYDQALLDRLQDKLLDHLLTDRQVIGWEKIEVDEDFNEIEEGGEDDIEC